MHATAFCNELHYDKLTVGFTITGWFILGLNSWPYILPNVCSTWGQQIQLPSNSLYQCITWRIENWKWLIKKLACCWEIPPTVNSSWNTNFCPSSPSCELLHYGELLLECIKTLQYKYTIWTLPRNLVKIVVIFVIMGFSSLQNFITLRC